MKRLFDLILAISALIIFAPIMLMVAVVVRLCLGKPIIFYQLRPGLNAKPFYLYKFRSMTTAVDSNGNLLSDKERLTILGGLLRKFSFDELPQLFNVIKGDLSIVGPRPLLMEYLDLYSAEQARRHLVKPGVTGWAQVNGRNAIGWEEKFQLDVWYVENHSLWLDVIIILLTIKKVFMCQGINADGEVPMSRFKGSKK